VTQYIGWRRFENSLKTEARFFSRTAANQLTSIFDGIGKLLTCDGRPLVVDAGPGTSFHTLYRARPFQSDDKLQAALSRPDIFLGSPPAHLANAGRINARGISVFCGTNSKKAAIAEFRPPVGSQVVVAQFDIIRKLRLLDLTALNDLRDTGSITDFGLAGRREDAVFLRSLSERIAQPALFDDEPSEYLTTQAIVDFLATESSVPIDGIIFPSVQAIGDVFDVVLFHKAARVEPINVPEGTEISSTTGRWTEEGWVDDYEVVEKIPPQLEEDDKGEQPRRSSHLTVIADAAPLDPRDADWRHITLRVASGCVEVHRVKHVEFATDRFMVKRRRREEGVTIDF